MKTKSVELKAPVAEMFVSYQGEGLYVGEPQFFVRFAGCDLRCDYCDTPGTQVLAEKQQFVSVKTIVERAKSAKAKARTVALTGGEPLLYPTFLQQLLPQLRKAGLRVYLETNGTLPEELHAVIRGVDVVAMDIKLPSSCGEELWQQHRQFLKEAGKKAFAKVVVTGKSTDREIKKAVDLVAGVSRQIPLVIQPCTPIRNVRGALPEQLYTWLGIARKKLTSVHLLPQMHKIWDIR